MEKLYEPINQFIYGKGELTEELKTLIKSDIKNSLNILAHKSNFLYAEQERFLTLFSAIPELFEPEYFVQFNFNSQVILIAALRGFFPPEFINSNEFITPDGKSVYSSECFLYAEQDDCGIYTLLNAPELYEHEPENDHLDDLCMPERWVDYDNIEENDWTLLKEKRTLPGLGDPAPMAIASDDVEALRKAMTDESFDPNYLYNSDNLVSFSIKWNAMKCFKYLLLEGNVDSYEAFSIACGSGRTEMISILEQNGIDFKKSDHPIECAIDACNIGVFNWLYDQHKEDFNLENVLSKALRGNNFIVVLFLLKQGVPLSEKIIFDNLYGIIFNQMELIDEFLKVNPNGFLNVLFQLKDQYLIRDNNKENFISIGKKAIDLGADIQKINPDLITVESLKQIYDELLQYVK